MCVCVCVCVSIFFCLYFYIVRKALVSPALPLTYNNMYEYHFSFTFILNFQQTVAPGLPFTRTQTYARTQTYVTVIVLSFEILFICFFILSVYLFIFSPGGP